MSKELETARELVRLLEEKENNSKVELKSLESGDTFKIREHEFIVLEQFGEKTKVISKNLLVENVIFGDSRNYKESNIKKIIEERIQPMIEKAVGADNLVECDVDLTSVDMQNEFGICKCKVRPLTFDEARLYNNILVNDSLSDSYWTLTPWSTENRGRSYSIAVVFPFGDICFNDFANDFGVRPVCILKSNILVER